MDGNLDDGLQHVRRAGLSLYGGKTRLTLFGNNHLRNPVYLSWLRDPEIVKSLNLPSYFESAVPFDEVAAYVEVVMRSPRDLFMAMHYAIDDEFIGTVKAGHIDWYAGTADIGIMIGRKDLWGRGLATDALFVLCRYCFEVLDLRRLTAGVMATNLGMTKVFEKLGFRTEGVFRQQDRLGNEFIDHIHLGCLKPEFQNLQC